MERAGSGLGGFLERGLEEQDVLEHGLEELLLVVGERELEQAAGVAMEALGWRLQLAAQAIGLGTAGVAQFGFEASVCGLFEFQG
jgi:hypothetical protein